MQLRPGIYHAMRSYSYNEKYLSEVVGPEERRTKLEAGKTDGKLLEMKGIGTKTSSRYLEMHMKLGRYLEFYLRKL